MTKRPVAIAISTFAALIVTAAPASAVEGATGPCAGSIGYAQIPVEQGPGNPVCAANTVNMFLGIAFVEP